MDNSVFLRKVLTRGIVFFLVFNLLLVFLPCNPGKVSLYNSIFPGRERLPYGENPQESYNLSLFDLDAMFSSHILSAEDGNEEYRVVLIGDSSLWGWLLRPDETLAGQLNATDMKTCHDERVRFYNLGYPSISLTKDLLILEKSLEYNPDLVIWLITLEAFPAEKQLEAPLVAHNPEAVIKLIDEDKLPINVTDQNLVPPNYWERSIIGQRRELADLARLQLYGFMWSATRIDQVYPDEYERAQTDFKEDESFHGMIKSDPDESNLAYPVLEAGMKITGASPIILINEPILISDGENSELRYNYYYPRWAYDQYRAHLNALADNAGWDYHDLWDLVPASEFTNMPFHVTKAGETLIASQIINMVQGYICP
jgi:hypothetical protein